MSLPRQLRDESDFDQLPNDVPVAATIADIEEKKGFIDYYVFVIEVKNKGSSKYLIYRRYREFLQLHQLLETKYSGEGSESPGPATWSLPTLPGKIYLGNKREIAESRIPELTLYMKKLLALPTWLLLDEDLRMFFYQSDVDSMEQPQNLRRLRPPRAEKTVKEKMDLLSSPRAEVLFDFRGSGTTELNLKKGQLVFLLRQVNADWLEGTVKDHTGIFPQSFVKIIKPLPPSDCDNAEGPSYSCLRCFLVQPHASDTRDVCVQEDLGHEPAYKDLLSRMRMVFQKEDIALNYRDLHGDLIRLLDDEDVLLMIQQSRLRPRTQDRPDNQFLWELHVTLTSDLSVYTPTVQPIAFRGFLMISE
uniref:Neutrophil cytosol factor 4 n=1 Tax=Neogobius melanostomus TaxID=47308 RepID=A0A8C6T9M1_9GOBI